MYHFDVKVDSSVKLLKLFHSKVEDPSVWDNIQRALFAFCTQISKEEIYLAFLYAQKVLQENPVQFRQRYKDAVVCIQNSLNAVCQEQALKQVLVALEKSGNEKVIDQILEVVRVLGNYETEPACPSAELVVNVQESRSKVSQLQVSKEVTTLAPLCTASTDQDQDIEPGSSLTHDDKCGEQVEKTGTEDYFNDEKESVSVTSEQVSQYSEGQTNETDQEYSAYKEQYKLIDFKIVLERLPLVRRGERRACAVTSSNASWIESSNSSSSSSSLDEFGNSDDEEESDADEEDVSNDNSVQPRKRKKESTVTKKPNKCVKCEVCGRTFSSGAYLTRHLASHSEARNFPCSTCPRTYKYKAELKAHIRSAHTGELSFTCHHCGKGFFRSAKLMRHIQGVHEGKKDRPWECQLCKMRFAGRHNIYEHVRVVHKISGTEWSKVAGFRNPIHDTSGNIPSSNTESAAGIVEDAGQDDGKEDGAKYDSEDNVKPRKPKKATTATVRRKRQARLITCDVDGCQSRHRTADALEIHKKKVHEGIRSPHVCLTCKKTFVTSYKLQRHCREVHEKVKCVTCEICGHTLSRASNLAHHLASHSDARNFLCAQCPQTYKYEKELTDHIRSAHTGERPFICHHCGKGFVASSKLKRHILGVHEGKKDRPWMCQLCQMRFSGRYNLYAHVKVVHKIYGKGWTRVAEFLKSGEDVAGNVTTTKANTTGGADQKLPQC